MATTQKPAPKPEDIEAQIGKIREDVNTLTRLLTELAGEKAKDTRDLAVSEAAELIRSSKARADSARRKVGEKADSIEHYIEENPIQSALIALGAGIVVGWLSRR